MEGEGGGGGVAVARGVGEDLDFVPSGRRSRVGKKRGGKKRGAIFGKGILRVGTTNGDVGATHAVEIVGFRFWG